MNQFSNTVILASSSPRRKEILADMGVKYEVIPANIDESEIKSRFPFCSSKNSQKQRRSISLASIEATRSLRRTQLSFWTAKCTENRTIERVLSI